MVATRLVFEDSWDQPRLVGMRLSDFRAYITAKNVIRAAPHPDPARRLTAEKALSHTWLTSIAENFDQRARWRNAIKAARALCFAKSSGVNNNKKYQLALSSDDEYDDGSRAGRRRGARRRNQTPRDSTFHLHRQMNPCCSAGWRDSW